MIKISEYFELNYPEMYDLTSDINTKKLPSNMIVFKDVDVHEYEAGDNICKLWEIIPMLTIQLPNKPVKIPINSSSYKKMLLQAGVDLDYYLSIIEYEITNEIINYQEIYIKSHSLSRTNRRSTADLFRTKKSFHFETLNKVFQYKGRGSKTDFLMLKKRIYEVKVKSLKNINVENHYDLEDRSINKIHKLVDNNGKNCSFINFVLSKKNDTSISENPNFVKTLVENLEQSVLKINQLKDEDNKLNNIKKVHFEDTKKEDKEHASNRLLIINNPTQSGVQNNEVSSNEAETSKTEFKPVASKIEVKQNYSNNQESVNIYRNIRIFILILIVN